jgi:hypothetical protein
VRTLWVVGIALFALVPGALATTAPSLHVRSLDPLVLQGSTFHPAERVRVTVVVNGETLRRTAKVTARGSFRTVFGVVSFGRCGSFSARAVGTGGSLAVLKRPPLPACMPARSP